MKRGLVLLDPKEIAPDELEGRITSLQRSLQQQGVAAALIYGDVYRSGDITYLSNICLYWNEGVLVVPSTGTPAFLTKLSRRVHPWMHSISTIKDLRSGANLADLAGEFLGDTRSNTIGLVEMDWWPALLVEDLQGKLIGARLQDLGPIVRQERKSPSPSELRLLRESAKISAKSVAVGLDRSSTNAERAGRAELTARMAGVEDVLVYCHPSTDQADTVEVLAEYRGYWTIAARTVFKSSPEWAPLLCQAYEAAEKRLRKGADIAELRMAVSAELSGSTIPWRIDLIHHTDLETCGDYRLPNEETHPIQEGSVVGMRLEFAFADGTQAVAADTFEIDRDGAVRLTNDLPQQAYLK